MPRILVWDLPTRLFHWLFAASVLAAYVLGEEEGWLGWHSYFGYLAGGAVLFRLVWGFAGGRYSRFSTFPPRPRAAVRYLSALVAGRAERQLGHNPAGALAIHALLFLGLAAAATGVALLAADKGMGPLAGLVPASWEGALEEAHEILANALLAVAGLHILGVLAGSLGHGENLPRAMVTGYKTSRGGPGAGVKPARAVAAAMLAGVVLFSVFHDFRAACGGAVATCPGDDDHEETRERGEHPD